MGLAWNVAAAAALTAFAIAVEPPHKELRDKGGIMEQLLEKEASRRAREEYQAPEQARPPRPRRPGRPWRPGRPARRWAVVEIRGLELSAEPGVVPAVTEEL